MSAQHSIASLEGWSRTTDRNARTQPGRDGLQRRFEREVDERDPEGRMSPEDRAKAIEDRRRLHFKRMAAARWKGRQAS